MTNTEIVEGNKIIAEFMGVDECGKPNWEYRYWFIGGISVREDELKYHSSWDWLMPVWGKLGKEMYKIRRQISGEDYKKAEVLTIHILTSFREVDITSAFNWILEAIQWYNNQSKI
jgi:hypothetical protein